jgi:hypothetical protein
VCCAIFVADLIMKLSQFSSKISDVTTDDKKRTTKFTWTITGTSKPPGAKITSPPILIGGVRWVLDLYPRGYVLPDHSSLYLSLSEPNAQAADWSAHVSFSLGLLHPATKERSVWTSFSKLFSTQVHSWGKNNFYPISDSRAMHLPTMTLP